MAKSITLYFFENSDNGAAVVSTKEPVFKKRSDGGMLDYLQEADDAYTNYDICEDGLGVFGLKPSMLNDKKFIRVKLSIDEVKVGTHQVVTKTTTKYEAPKPPERLKPAPAANKDRVLGRSRFCN